MWQSGGRGGQRQAVPSKQTEERGGQFASFSTQLPTSHALWQSPQHCWLPSSQYRWVHYIYLANVVSQSKYIICGISGKGKKECIVGHLKMFFLFIRWLTSYNSQNSLYRLIISCMFLGRFNFPPPVVCYLVPFLCWSVNTGHGGFHSLSENPKRQRPKTHFGLA